MLRPGQTAFTHDHPVRINSLGLRDREITLEPGPGASRVLALGDSQTFGAGLALANTWPKQLERMFREGVASQREVEVVNAGIPGTDTWQHEILLRRLLKMTNPHVVVLALYVNDVVPAYTPRRVGASALTNTRGHSPSPRSGIRNSPGARLPGPGSRHLRGSRDRGTRSPA